MQRFFSNGAPYLEFLRKKLEKCQIGNGNCFFFLTIYCQYYVKLQAGYVKYATNSDYDRGSLP